VKLAEARTITPAELAHALGQFPPTPAQEAVIAAPLSPALVVAGAGAGKTETMASRVVWLVANGFALPEEILGLTFTKKAAGQLTTRIRSRLARLAGSDLLRDIDPSGQLRERISGSEPEIGTYHAYAGRLLGEYGLLAGIEPSARLLSETELWQAAYGVVSSWDADLDTDSTPGSVTKAVLALAGELAEHLVDPADLAGAHSELETLVHTLPKGKGQRGGPNKELLGIVDAQRRRVELLPLVAELDRALRAQGALDFGSQMSLSARLAADHPEVGVGERSRFRVVLLDEYQDTGHSQRVLLSALFGGGVDANLAVTAVGDPMQSIYGWRGASAANLSRFPADFPLGSGEPAPVLELLTSWRNPPEALALANRVCAPLRRRGLAVGELAPRPDSVAGDVRLALAPDVVAEREWVAAAIAEQYALAAQAGKEPPSAAVLVRRNQDSVPLAEALRAHGLPVEVVGAGGLLHAPEVADVVATLRVLADPLAGSAAVRLLTGGRWRLGATDLAALHARSRRLSARRDRGAAGAVTDADALEAAVAAAIPGDAAESAGLIDAVADPGPEHAYSEVGLARIKRFGNELNQLRSRLNQPLTELAADVERTLGLGIETGARLRVSGGTGREHLDAFADVVAAYAGRSDASLPGLLAYLAAAEEQERGLDPGEVQVDRTRVQVLTVHAAKGLEWEVVAVPHVVAGIFPSDKCETWQGALGELPTSLRGDRAMPESPDGVPVLDISAVTDRKEIQEALADNKQALRDRKMDEDRRLFYVAITRTERVLLLSAHHWPESGDKPKGPSEFLTELRDHAEACGAVVEAWADAPEEGTPNPLQQTAVSALWPADPLGARRGEIERGAALVAAALAQPEDDAAQDDDDPENWAADVDALLAERAARSQGGAAAPLPTQLSVSQLVELRADPEALAARLRRPLPFKPNPMARRGTAFHAWVEERFGESPLLDWDELPGAADPDPAPEGDLTALQQAFLRGEWAERRPVEVEVPFETTIAGTVVRGRIDAVYADADGGFTVVDWKTGAEPAPAELPALSVQLAAYRLAWAALSDVEPAKVRAAFHYVRSGRTLAPVDLLGAQALANLVRTQMSIRDNGTD
jgi:DNA helicase-2/ATP-dependent DNA helicase PcrA